MPPGNGRNELLRRQGSALQHGLHQPLIADSQRLVPGVLVHPKVHKALAQPVVELFQQFLFAGAGQIHLIHKDKGGDVVPPQQPPERFGMALHAVRPADDQHGVIQHLERPLRLGGKVHMAGGIQQRDGRLPRREQGLFGKDGDAAGLFQRVGVQKGVFVVHPAQFSDGAGTVEHGL